MGSLHVICVTKSRKIFFWGDNDEGQLGNGSYNSVRTPTQSGIFGKEIKLKSDEIIRVAAGSAHSVLWTTKEELTGDLELVSFTLKSVGRTNFETYFVP